VTARVSVLTDLRLQLANRPGSMASLFEAFEAAGVSVHGVAAIGEDDTDADHFLVEDPEAAVAAAARAGASELRRRAVLVRRPDDAGSTIGQLLRGIAAAGAGIDLMYTTLDGSVVIGAVPFEAAREAMEAP
jgi:hypothetical protein